MKAKKEKPVPEKEVVGMWRKQVRCQNRVTGTSGEALEVVYPGRLNDSRGGDFRDAVISAGSNVQYGNIEIHTRTSGWKAHGHQNDPHYNQVVLHVAMEKDTVGETTRQDGKVIPTIILNRALLREKKKYSSGQPSPCRTGKTKRQAGEILELLERAGMERFRLKAMRFNQELAEADEGQSLYLGVMEALGYSQNSRQFLRLGRLLPVSRAESFIRKGNEERSLRILQAVLLGTAGLLPSQCGWSSSQDESIRGMERIWGGMSGNPAMSGHEWEFFRVRPGNSPVRRIVSLSRLILRFQARGWQHSLEELMLGMRSNQDFEAVETALMVKGDDKTDGCLIPGQFLEKSSGLTLLGRERARDIVINVLMPYMQFRAGCGSSKFSSDLTDKLFHLYPRCESNSIERHMREQLGLAAGQIKTACLQQGMIHIYRQYCIRGKCRECRLGSTQG